MGLCKITTSWPTAWLNIWDSAHDEREYEGVRRHHRPTHPIVRELSRLDRAAIIWFGRHVEVNGLVHELQTTKMPMPLWKKQVLHPASTSRKNRISRKRLEGPPQRNLVYPNSKRVQREQSRDYAIANPKPDWNKQICARFPEIVPYTRAKNKGRSVQGAETDILSRARDSWLVQRLSHAGLKYAELSGEG